MPKVTVVNQMMGTIELSNGDLIVVPGCTFMVVYRLSEENGVPKEYRRCFFIDLTNGVMFTGPTDSKVSRERLYDIIQGYYDANFGFKPEHMTHVSSNDYKIDITIGR